MNNLDKIKDFAEKFDKFRNHLREECTKPSVSSTNSEAIKKIKISLIILWKKKLGELNMIPKVSHNDLFTRCWEKLYLQIKTQIKQVKRLNL